MDQMIKYHVNLGAPRSRIRSVINLLGKNPVKDKEGGEQPSDPSAGQIPVKGEREERIGQEESHILIKF